MSEQSDTVLRLVGEKPISTEGLLDEVLAFLKKFVVYPSSHAAIAHVLWVFHTHCMDQWDSTPRLVFLSPEPGSGKTRALEISETLVPRPIEAVNTTPAYLFRKVSDEDGVPTILYDEIDTIFGPKARDNEEIRGFLNAGHRRGAMAGRCVTIGKKVTTEELPAYCAVAMAGLKHVPTTIRDRSVVIHMRKRAPTEEVSPYRRRIHSDTGNALRNRIETWAEKFSLAGNYPDMPQGVEDRAADVWEPLIAIADVAGGRWSKNARDAAVSFVKGCRETEPSYGVRLLSDLRVIFATDTQLSTKTILQRLNDLEEAPWGDLRGKPLDARRMAKFLSEYGVKSGTIRLPDEQGRSTLKGYKVESLHDAWIRYLPTPETSVTSVTASQVNADAGFGVSDKSDVTDTSVTNELQSSSSNLDSARDVTDVTDVTAVGEDPKATEQLTI